MINVMIPLAGTNPLFPKSEYPFSKPLVEIDGKPMIQLAIENLQTIDQDIHFIFLVKAEDCKNFFLDHTLRLLTENQSTIIKIDKDTRGAACSALLAIDEIDNDTPLIICNGDQIIKEDLNKIIDHLSTYDAGVVTITSVHPRWSYIRTDGDEVIETAEKRPISKDAIAGVFYYAKGSDYVRAAMEMIKKDAHYNDMYYIASTLNELILENKRIGFYKIPVDQYECFYSPEKIKEYENRKHKKEHV
ncbi:MAG: glycosyltransferase family 2 protein [Sulfurimonadaceae bacterium]